MRLILYYIRYHGKPIDSHTEKINKFIRKQKITIGDIIIQHNQIPTVLIFESLCWMYYKNMLNMNLDSKELGIETEVWVDA